MARQSSPPRQARTARSKIKLNTYYSSGQSASDKSGPLKPKSFKGHKLYGWGKRVLQITIVLGMGALVIHSLILNPTPRITVNDGSYHPAKTYQTEAVKQFSYLKNKNKITFDEQGIANTLKNQFPEIDSVDFQLPLLGKTANIYISVSGPALFLKSQGQIFVIDQKGRAVALATVMPQAEGLIPVEDQSGYPVQIGNQVLNAQEVSFISSLNNQAKKSKITVSSIVIPQKAQELDIRTVDKPYSVKFYLGGDPAVQIGQWLAARAQFEKDGTTPDKYLDVRVQGKIYYR